MTTIYCSKKFSDFLGKQKFDTSENLLTNNLGGWNGHLFYYDRKKFLIFTNNKTYYALLFPAIKKADLRNFEDLFLQRLNEQFVYDNIISGPETSSFAQRILPIRLAKTNNDKKAIGTLNEFILQFKDSSDYFDLNNHDLAVINSRLNNIPVGASRPGQGKYGRPIEDMKALIDSVNLSI